MPFDYESLVGHLYIVGGRALSVPPPGALVEVAPKKAARGREADTFFVLMLPSGDAIGPAKFYESMAQLAAERYFTSSGSVTAGLRHTFDTLNQNLVQHNTQGKRRYEASMLCAVLKGSDLYVGKVGSGIVLLYHAGELQSLPENLSDDEAIFRAPLGVHPMPDVKMTRYTVASGSRLMLSDAGLADTDREKLVKAISAKAAVEIVTPEPTAEGSPPTPEVKPEPAGDIGMALVSLKEAVLSSLKANVTALGAEFVPPESPVPANARTGESTAAILSSGVKPVEENVNKPVIAQPEPRRRERRSEKALQEIRDKTKNGAGAAALKTAEGMEGVQKVFDHYFPDPQEGKKSWLTSPIAAIAVILIPLSIVGLVLFMWLAGTGESEFEICVEDATAASELARSIPPSDVEGSRGAWNSVINQVNHCNELHPGDEQLASLLSEAQDHVDRMDYVSRREGIPIATTPSSTTLSALVLQGLDLYTLDNVNNLVYHATLTDDGRSAIRPTLEPIADMRQGASVGSFVVGDIFDIAWAQDAGGSSSGRVIIAVDTEGTVISCPARFLLQCTSHRLLGVENWRNPKAIVIWQGRLYVMDDTQIWRYDPSGGNYTSPPSEYFSGEGRPPLELAIDFDITEAPSGRVYVLLNNGTVMSFSGGSPEPFGFSAFPLGLEPTTANGMFLNQNPLSQSLYLVNASTRTIYETSFTGTFFFSYRTFEEDQFASLGGIAADTSLGMIYVTSGNAIFGIVRNEG